MSKKQLLKQAVPHLNIPLRKGTPKFKAEGAHVLNLKLWGPTFLKACLNECFLPFYVGAPLLTLCFEDVVSVE